MAVFVDEQRSGNRKSEPPLVVKKPKETEDLSVEVNQTRATIKKEKKPRGGRLGGQCCRIGQTCPKPPVSVR